VPTNHRILKSPTPTGNVVRLEKPSPHIDAPTKDYKCMMACLQQVKIYAACEQQCTPILVKLKPTSQFSAAFDKKMEPIPKKTIPQQTCCASRP
jgi:hypothetical protein